MGKQVVSLGNRTRKPTDKWFEAADAYVSVCAYVREKHTSKSSGAYVEPMNVCIYFLCILL